jgi:NADPH:quinone reductase
MHDSNMTDIPSTMRAVRIHTPGGVDALQLDTIAVPEPAAGEALVKVQYAGVNFVDVYKRTGMYPMPLPATLGEEGAGYVAAVGPHVKEVKPGDRVAWSSINGAYAEYAVVPAARLVPLPAAIHTQTAAAVMLQGMTAHYLSTSTFPVKSGDICLVHAASGGVGLLLVQIAKKHGGHVIGTAGSEEKAELARKAGADYVILYTQQDFVAETKRITEGKGVHVVYDSVGKTTFLSGLDVLAPRGMMVLFGASSGPVAPIDPQILNRKGSLFLTRPTLVNYIATRDELLWRSDDLFDWIERGELSVRIDSTFPLERVGDAHNALEGRKTKGKVLIAVSAD